MKRIPILVIEAERERLSLLKEALTEIQELNIFPAWSPGLKPRFLSSLAWAAANPSPHSAECIVLDLDHCGPGPTSSSSTSTPFDALAHARAAYPTAALVVCSGIFDPALATAVLRHGADEYISFDELTGEFFARAVKQAVTRRQLRLSEEHWTDPLTGLPSRSGFVQIAQRDFLLARERRVEFRLASFYFPELFAPGPDGLAANPHQTDLWTLDIAERLRRTLPACDVLARIDRDLFLMASALPGADPLAAVEQMFASRGYGLRAAYSSNRLTSRSLLERQIASQLRQIRHPMAPLWYKEVEKQMAS